MWGTSAKSREDEAATRDACRSPGFVTTGTPALPGAHA